MSATLHITLQNFVVFFCAGAIALSLTVSQCWAQGETGADTKCRYDFARRKMVCDPVAPSSPNATQPAPAPSAEIPMPIPAAPEEQTRLDNSDNRDYVPKDDVDSAEQRDHSVAPVGELDLPVELRIVGLRPPRKLPMREGPSRREYVVGRIPFDAQGVRLIDCPTNNWCKVTYQGESGFVRRRFVKPIDPDVVWERDRQPRYRVARVHRDDTLNIRRGPSTETPIVGRIPADAQGITIRGQCRYEWCPIQYGRLRGWAGSYYLAREN